MKTRALFLVCAILALAACSNDDNVIPLTPPEPEPTPTEQVQPITFNLTATHPNDAAATRGGESGGWRWQSWDDGTADAPVPDMTRAVKQTWEAGDAIFVFFTNVNVPLHLKMTYDGTQWTSVEYDGDEPSPGALQFSDGDTGTMTAVHLAYGNNATVSAGGEPDEQNDYHSFAFSGAPYAYYMTATLPYEVVDNTISGAFNMMIADGFVQFFVEDAAADKYVECLLGTDAVIPVGVATVSDDGTITETSDKTASDDLPGFFYDDGNVKGYVFYGKLDPNYQEMYKVYNWQQSLSFVYPEGERGYYFSKTKPDYIDEPDDLRDERYDYFVRGRTLASHDAVKLPVASSRIHFNDDGSFAGGKWLEVGGDPTIKLQNIADEGTTELGTWYISNYNQSLPESYGDRYTVSEASLLTHIPHTYDLPSPEQFQALINKCTWTYVKLHGRTGFVAKCDTGFLFFPLHDDKNDYYWTNDFGTGEQPNIFWLEKGKNPCIGIVDTGNTSLPIRLIVK